MLIHCPNCNAEIEDNTHFCGHCGVSLNNTNGTVIQQKTHKSKKILTISIIIVILAVITFVVLTVMKKKKEEEYLKELQDVCGDMLVSSSVAINYCSDIKDVWYNAIFEISDEETDPYTKLTPNSSFFYDFSIAVANYQYDDENYKVLDSITANKEKVVKAMKDLENPPSKYKGAYENLKEYYDVYLSVINLAISPSGSYQSFSEDIRNADNDIAKCYDKMSAYFN